MAKLRHIAIIVPDPEAAATFFEQAFDMKRAGTARRGIYMSDGTVNVALLKKEHENEKIGIYHFGMWVDDLDASEKKVLDAGGTYLEGRPTSPNSYYEAKYRDPLGIVWSRYPGRVIAGMICFFAFFSIALGLGAWLPNILAERGFGIAKSLNSI